MTLFLLSVLVQALLASQVGHSATLCTQLRGQENLNAPFAPRADVNLLLPCLVCRDRLQGTGSQQHESQWDCGLPVVPGACGRETAGWLTAGQTASCLQDRVAPSELSALRHPGRVRFP